MSFRPVFIKQGDGTRCGWYNCNPASTAMATHRYQRGADPIGTAPWPPTPEAIRNVIYGSGSCTGTNNTQNASAAKTLYGVSLSTRWGVPWSDFVTLLNAGYGASVMMSYATVHGTRFDSCPSFTGAHSIYVNETAYLGAGGAYVGSAAGTYALVGDPLADGRWLSSAGRYALSGFQWWPISTLAQSCGAIAGSGLVSFNLSIDTEYPSTVSMAAGAIGINVRTGPTTSVAAYGKTNGISIVRSADAAPVLPQTSAFPLIAWVEGGSYTVNGVTSTTWAQVLLDGAPRYIAKLLVR